MLRIPFILSGGIWLKILIASSTLAISSWYSPKLWNSPHSATVKVITVCFSSCACSVFLSCRAARFSARYASTPGRYCPSVPVFPSVIGLMSTFTPPMLNPSSLNVLNRESSVSPPRYSTTTSRSEFSCSRPLHLLPDTATSTSSISMSYSSILDCK